MFLEDSGCGKKWTERVIEVLGRKLSALEGLAALMVCIIVISR